jgi:hypothetical protein
MVRRTTKLCWRAEFIGLRRILDSAATTPRPTIVCRTQLRITDTGAAAASAADHGPLSTA